MVQQQPLEGNEPCNNIVAQSDYEAALAAIESTFESFLVSQPRQENDSDLDQELIEEIYKTAKTSLLNNVKRIVRPIDDNDYNDYVDQYHVVWDEESDNEDNDVQQSNVEESEDEGEEEIDLEELVDMKAWKDAQKLRTRIRTMSNTVQEVRERVLKNTEKSILSSISEQLVDQPVKIVFDDADEKENNNNIALQDSLRELSKVLKDPKWARLPNRIQSMQNTIETVQKETSEDRVMSQTEIAITSQTKTVIDESRRKMLEEGCDENAPNYNTANAMDRLALFGQMFS